MKKFLLAAVLVGLAQWFVSAGEITGITEYSGSNSFNQVKALALWQFRLNWSIGLEGKWAKEDAFKEPIYAIKTPLSFTTDLFSFSLKPFYYFENKSDHQKYNAFGIAGRVVLMLEDDSLNELYSHAFIGAAFARQQGILVWEDGHSNNQYYSQAAYTLGLHKNFFRAFSFEAIGTAFQYPDGINGKSFHGIMDQQDLVSLQSFDIVHDLPKYTLAGRITRLWADRHATLYVSYRFGEFYTADPEHSVILGNTFTLTQWALCDLAYNHIRSVHNDNKRDIFYAQLRVIF